MYLTVQEYFEKCEQHSWHYARTEDINQYRRGAQSESNLRVLASASPVFKKIFSAFYNWANNDGEKPILEDYIESIKR